MRPWQALARVWRFIAVLLAFLIFGVVGLGFQVLLLPLQPRGTGPVSVRRQMLARRIVAASWRFLVRYLDAAGLVSMRLEGFERLGRPG